MYTLISVNIIDLHMMSYVAYVKNISSKYPRRQSKSIRAVSRNTSIHLIYDSLYGHSYTILVRATVSLKFPLQSDAFSKSGMMITGIQG